MQERVGRWLDRCRANHRRCRLGGPVCQVATARERRPQHKQGDRPPAARRRRQQVRDHSSSVLRPVPLHTEQAPLPKQFIHSSVSPACSTWPFPPHPTHCPVPWHDKQIPPFSCSVILGLRRHPPRPITFRTDPRACAVVAVAQRIRATGKVAPIALTQRAEAAAIAGKTSVGYLYVHSINSSPATS